MWISKHKEASYGVESWNASATHDYTNGIKHTSAPKIHKLMFGVKKLSGSDVDRFKPYGNQATHFTSCTENLNVANHVYKGKKPCTTFETRPTNMHIIGEWGENTSRAGCCSKVKSVNMC